jgi:Secretion system C-terminal sorting domain
MKSIFTIFLVFGLLGANFAQNAIPVSFSITSTNLLADGTTAFKAAIVTNTASIAQNLTLSIAYEGTNLSDLTATEEGNWAIAQTSDNNGVLVLVLQNTIAGNPPTDTIAKVSGIIDNVCGRGKSDIFAPTLTLKAEVAAPQIQYYTATKQLILAGETMLMAQCYNVAGASVWQQTLANNSASIDLSSLQQGVYIVVVQTTSGNFTTKIVVN